MTSESRDSRARSRHSAGLVAFVFFFSLPVLALDFIREPIPAADVTALAFDWHQPRLVLAGTSAGQIYRSLDGGHSWRLAAGELPFPGLVVAELTADRAIPRRFYAALWRLWGDGGAIVRSDDAGESWSIVPGLPDAAFRAIEIAPGAPYVILAGGAAGVFQSTNGGENFSRISPVGEEWRRLESLAVDPRTPLRIYAGTWRRAYRSDDGGRNWTTIWRGMVEDSDVFDVLIDPLQPDRLFAATCGWVYRSTDRGKTWKRFETGFLDRRIHGLSRGADGSLLAASCAGVHRADAAGETWEPIGRPCDVIAAIAHDPHDPQRMLAAVEHDAPYLSEDGGRTWARAADGLSGAHVLAAEKRADGTLAALIRHGNGESLWLRGADQPWEMEACELPTMTACPKADLIAPIVGLPIRGACPIATDQSLVITAGCGLYRAVGTSPSAAND